MTEPADCYSADERAAMEWTQRLRGAWLEPLLRPLSRAGIRPGHITLISLAVGLAFVPLWFWSRPAALAAVWLHVLFDGLDGPLARFQGVASRRGSFSDSMADQAVVVATTVTLMATNTIGVVPGAVYIVAYSVVLLFAMVRNALAIPYGWLVRPRFVVYSWIAVECLLFAGTIDWVLWAFNVLLVGKLVSGFVRIRRKIE